MTLTTALTGIVFIVVAISVWGYITYCVARRSRRLGSQWWPIHTIGALVMGLPYAVGYYILTDDG